MNKGDRNPLDMFPGSGSTQEEKDEHYRNVRISVINARSVNNGAIPNDWGQAKDDERFCKEYVQDQRRRESKEETDKYRHSDHYGGYNKAYRLTKRKSNDKPTDDDSDI